MRLRADVALGLLGMFGRAWGTIGPVTDLTIVNKVISPEGFTRDAVLADGQFPGPLTVSNKVRREAVHRHSHSH